MPICQCAPQRVVCFALLNVILFFLLDIVFAFVSHLEMRKREVEI